MDKSLTITFEGKHLLTALTTLLPIAPKPKRGRGPHYVEGIWFRWWQGNIDIVATNGHVLTRLSFDVTPGSIGEGAAILSYPDAVALAAALKRNALPIVGVEFAPGRIAFALADITLTYTPMDVKMPDYFLAIADTIPAPVVSFNPATLELATRVRGKDGFVRMSLQPGDPCAPIVFHPHGAYTNSAVTHTQTILMPVRMD